MKRVLICISLLTPLLASAQLPIGVRTTNGTSVGWSNLGTSTFNGPQAGPYAGISNTQPNAVFGTNSGGFIIGTNPAVFGGFATLMAPQGSYYGSPDASMYFLLNTNHSGSANSWEFGFVSGGDFAFAPAQSGKGGRIQLGAVNYIKEFASLTRQNPGTLPFGGMSTILNFDMLNTNSSSGEQISVFGWITNNQHHLSFYVPGFSGYDFTSGTSLSLPTGGAMFDLGTNTWQIGKAGGSGIVYGTVNYIYGGQQANFGSELVLDGTSHYAKFGGSVNIDFLLDDNAGAHYARLGVFGNYINSGLTVGARQTPTNSTFDVIGTAWATDKIESGTSIRTPVLITTRSNRLPLTTITLTGSPFNWTNTTSGNVSVMASGATAYSASINGTSVFGSLAGSVTIPLQTNEWTTITYTVAPATVWKPY